MGALIMLLGAAALASEQPEQQIIAAPPDRRVDIVDGGTIALDIKEDESELSLGWSWSDMAREPAASGVGLTRRTYRIGFELPVGGGDNIADSETIDALDNGANVSAALTWFGTKSRDNLDSPAFARIMNIARERCKRDPAHEMTPEQCANHRPAQAFAIRYSGLGEATVNRTLLSPAYALGIEGRIGVNRFDYRTPVTLAESSETKFQFAAKVYGSVLPSDGLSMFTGSIEYQSAYEARDEEILCPAVVANPNSDCVKAAPGAPEEVEKLLLAADYRRVLGTIARLGEIAISPKASFDALSDEFEIELPLYLKPTRDIGFMPGVSVTYNSEKDDVVLGIFLRQSFSF